MTLRVASLSPTPAGHAAPAPETSSMSSTIHAHAHAHAHAHDDAPRVLAFDIGGTWIKIGVVDAAGRLLHVDRLTTLGADGGQTLVARLLDAAAPLVARYAPAGFAFSTLGVIDRRDGRLVGAVEAIPGYVGLSPKTSFEQAFGLPAIIENDGNCVALAEGWTGAAAGVPHYLALTLGTGIGGGIVIDGHL
jgi:predicted NBD/HSP70 family sugar kinase